MLSCSEAPSWPSAGKCTCSLAQKLSCSPWWPMKMLQNWFLHQNSSKIEFVLSSKFGYLLKLVRPLGDPEFFKTLVIKTPLLTTLQIVLMQELLLKYSPPCHNTHQGFQSFRTEKCNARSSPLSHVSLRICQMNSEIYLHCRVYQAYKVWRTAALRRPHPIEALAYVGWHMLHVNRLIATIS